jgi:AcrR family transcriptional regulator
VARLTAAERREAVLEAASEEFAAHGYERTSTEKIARRVGISQPYIFRLFGTKRNLFEDADGLRGLSQRLERHGAPIRAAIESMNGARFVHDRLELHGWQVEIADAQKVKGLAPLACKTDRIDAWVLAELARRDLVPAIWLPTRWCVRSGSGRAGGCTWCATARA